MTNSEQVEETESRYVWGTKNDHYDIIFQKLIDYLFANGEVDKDSKWTLTKYALFRLLYDYADEVINNFTYTPEQLIELIEYHEDKVEKFKKHLKRLASSKKEVTEQLLKDIGIEFETNGEEDKNEK
jgi:hypothetical protein